MDACSTTHESEPLLSKKVPFSWSITLLLFAVIFLTATSEVTHYVFTIYDNIALIRLSCSVGWIACGIASHVYDDSFDFRRNIFPTFLLSIVSILCGLTFSLSLKLTSAAIVNTAYQTSIIWVYFFSLFRGIRSFQFLALAALLACIIGTGMISFGYSDDDTETNSFLGVALAILSAFLFGILQDRSEEYQNHPRKKFLQYSICFLSLIGIWNVLFWLVYSFIYPPTIPSFNACIGLFLLSFCDTMGNITTFASLSIMNAVVVSVALTLTSPCGFLYDIFVNGINYSLIQVFGAIFVLAGVVALELQ